VNYQEVINIASRFDAKGFKQAETALGKLNSNAKKLAGSFGLAFGTAAVVQFGKQSVRAFIDAEREGTVLVNTVKNLGLAFDQPAIDAYIDKIGRLYGITGGQAVPAMQALLSATGSASKAQDIFNTAIDTSSALTLDVTDVAKALSQAYLGNTKALSNYNTGLTKAELAASDFDTIQTKLNKNFSGAGREAASTYSGQLLILTEAGNKAKEVIGKGIIDSLMILSGDTTVEDLADTMLEAAQNAAALSVNLSKVIKTLNTPLDLASKGLAWFVTKTSPLVNLIVEGDPSGFMDKSKLKPKSTPNKNPLGTFVLKTPEMLKQDAARAKAEKEAIARAKALALLVKEQAANQAKILKDKKLSAAIDKANLALGKGGAAFDIEAIQLEAAKINQVDQLKKATSAAQLLAITNDLTRLSVLRDIKTLEDAIASGDIKRIEAATKALNESTKLLGVLTNQELKIIDIKKLLEALAAKDLISLKNLNDAKAILDSLNIPSGGIIKVEISAAAEAALAALAAATAAAKVLAGGTVKKKFTGEEITDILRRLTSGQKITVAEGLAIGVTDPKSLRPDVATDIENRTTTSNSAPLPTAVPSTFGDPALLASIIAAVSIAATAAAENAAAIKAGTAQPVSVTNNFNGVIGDPNALASLITSIVQNAIDRGTIKAGTLV
jgi:hypothetical protein